MGEQKAQRPRASEPKFVVPQRLGQAAWNTETRISQSSLSVTQNQISQAPHWFVYPSEGNCQWWVAVLCRQRRQRRAHLELLHQECESCRKVHWVRQIHRGAPSSYFPQEVLVLAVVSPGTPRSFLFCRSAATCRLRATFKRHAVRKSQHQVFRGKK